MTEISFIYLFFKGRNKQVWFNVALEVLDINLFKPIFVMLDFNQ